MNSKTFSEAMNAINDKYLVEAVQYQKKDHPYGWAMWGTLAACLILCLIVSLNGSSLRDSRKESEGVNSAGDAPLLVFVNDTLYKQSLQQISYSEMNNEFVYLGKIESDITQNKSMMTDGVPKENFQANYPIVGAEVYRYGDDIVVQYDGQYWLYEAVLGD